MITIAVGAAAAGAFAVTRSPLLDVDRVHIAGASATGRDEVLAAAGLHGRRLMVDVRERVAARRLEALPWVQQATVTRRWPSTVEVSILERTPVAALPAGEEAWALADATGRVLDVTPERPADLVMVRTDAPVGDPGTVLDAGTARAVKLVATLDAPLEERVRELRVASGQVDLLIEPRPVLVRFGPAADVPAKLQALVTLLDRVDLRGVASIDVRVPAAPVLTRA